MLSKFSLGSIASAWTTQTLAQLLFAVEPLDPVISISAAILVLSVVFFSILVPVARGSRIRPVTTISTK